MALTKVKSSNITLTTPSASSNDTSPATTAYVTTALANLVDSAPSTLNTLNELAAALGDDVNFSTTVTNSIATKAPLASPTFTSNINGGDGVELRLGDSQDILLKHHAGGYGHLENKTGTLYMDSETFTIRTDVDDLETALFIDASQKVGIGTNSPTGKLHVDGHTSSIASIFEGNGNGDTVPVQLKVKANNGTTSTQGLYGNAGSASTDNTIVLGNSGTSGVLVNSSGAAAIGTTSPDGVSNLTVKSQNSTSGQEFVSLHHQATSGLVYFISFMTEASGVDRGYITYNNTGNTMQFTGTSDISLKENIRDLTGGLDFINQVKPRVFDWKEEERGKDQVGFIAQEVEEIKPEWVGEKEGLKNIPVNLPNSIPYLIKAIQEQQELIGDLKARIETLEG